MRYVCNRPQLRSDGDQRRSVLDCENATALIEGCFLIFNYFTTQKCWGLFQSSKIVHVYAHDNAIVRVFGMFEQ